MITEAVCFVFVLTTMITEPAFQTDEFTDDAFQTDEFTDDDIGRFHSKTAMHGKTLSGAIAFWCQAIERSRYRGEEVMHHSEK